MKLQNSGPYQWKQFFQLTCGLFLFLQFSISALAATEFKIIDLQHRFVEDILPTIQLLIGNDGTATGMQNHLIIRTSPEKMIEIEQIVSTLDVARQNLRITVSHQNNLQTTEANLGVNGRKRIGNVTIGTRKFPSNAPDGIQLDMESNQSNVSSNGNQFINVIDGESAYIKVGQSVPYTQEWVTFTRRYISVQKTTEFVDISTGFSVQPRSIGSQVALKITPRIAQLNQNKYIDFEELSTIVRVNRGEWLDLGSTMQQKDEVSRTILNNTNNRQSQSSALSIRVE